VKKNKAYTEESNEDLKLFPTGVWHWILSIMLALLAGGFLAAMLGTTFNMHPAWSYGLVWIGSLLVSIPNLLIAHGHIGYGIPLFRGTVFIFILVFFVIYAQDLNSGGEFILQIMPLLASLLAVRITFTYKYRAFTLNRQKYVLIRRKHKKLSTEIRKVIEDKKRRAGYKK